MSTSPISSQQLLLPPTASAHAAEGALNTLDVRIGEVAKNSGEKRKADLIAPDLTAEELANIEEISSLNKTKARLESLLNTFINTTSKKPYSSETQSILELVLTYLISTPNPDLKILKDLKSLLNSYLNCLSNLSGIEISLNKKALSSFEAGYKIFTQLALDSDNAYVKILHTQLHHEMSTLFEKRFKRFIEQTKTLVLTKMQKAKKARKTLTFKLITSDLSFTRTGPPLLDRHDLAIWTRITLVSSFFLRMAKLSPNRILQEQLFLLNQPISQHRLSTVIPTEEKVSRLFQMLVQNPSDPLLLLKEPYDWTLVGEYGKGSYKQVNKIRHVVTGALGALCVSSYSSKDDLSLKAGKNEADLMLTLRGKKGWAQVREVTYRSTIQGKKLLIQQGILMQPYTGDGTALLEFLQENPSFNTAENKLQIFQMLAKALNHLHVEHGLIHQDVKLDNILFEPNHETKTISVVMTDLGSATLKGSTGGFSCTWEVASEEYLLAQIKEHTYRLSHPNGTVPPNFFSQVAQDTLDIYGLGLIFYALNFGLTDNHPGLRTTYPERNLNVDNGHNEYLKSVDSFINEHVLPNIRKEWFKEPPIEDAIGHLIWRMCHNNLSIRPHSMQEVISLLSEIPASSSAAISMEDI